MVKITKNIVSKSIENSVTYGGKNSKKYIVIHETANTSKGANADTHGRLQANGNSRQASWHYSVDDKEAVQSFKDNAQCWHAGNASYNRNSIGIEICVNSDGDFEKSVKNAADLVMKLMKKHGISKSNVIQHNAASGKDCPHFMRAGSKGVSWSDFKSKLGDKTTSNSKPSKPSNPANKPSKSISKMADEVIAGKHGSGHANRRKSLGISKSQYKKVRKNVNDRSGKSSSSKPSKSKIKANITADGKWGKSTTRALQKELGTPVDGIISKQPKNSVSQSLYSGTVSFGSGGSNVIVALQKKVGVSADGKLGPSTIRGLQQYLGTPVDGKLNKVSPMVKKLQRKLNKGNI